MGRKTERLYDYDDRNLDLQTWKKPVSDILLKILKYFMYSVVSAVVAYGLFALLFNTDTERKLKQENRMYSKIYPEARKKERLLADVVASLKLRDDEIYREVFRTQAPETGRLSDVAFLAVTDTVPDEDIAALVETKADVLMNRSARIEDNFRRIFGKLSDGEFGMPPMSLPVKDFNYALTGASVGQKTSPFYKVKVEHGGLDMILQVGTPVYAAGPGTVVQTVKSGKGQGNVVEIEHEGGYVTRYAHLQDIAVAKGRTVEGGTLIGHSGMSGTAFAPHLHYEVLKDGKTLDPVNYFFRDMGPYEYTDMVIMSVSVEQSMD